MTRTHEAPATKRSPAELVDRARKTIFQGQARDRRDIDGALRGLFDQVASDDKKVRAAAQNLLRRAKNADFLAGWSIKRYEEVMPRIDFTELRNRKVAKQRRHQTNKQKRSRDNSDAAAARTKH